MIFIITSLCQHRAIKITRLILHWKQQKVGPYIKSNFKAFMYYTMTEVAKFCVEYEIIFQTPYAQMFLINHYLSMAWHLLFTQSKNYL